MIKYEIRASVRRNTQIRLVRASELSEYTGFRSVYGFDESVSDMIEYLGSTAGLDDFPVYSDVLLVDFDDEWKAADRLAEKLKRWGTGYKRYHSGGRSAHFHIPIRPLKGLDIPHRQKLWMEKHAPRADMSIYNKSSLFRLEGTYHRKYPGECKRLVEEFEGELLEIPKVRRKFIRHSDISTRSPEEAAIWVTRNEMSPAGEGGRNRHCHMLLKRCIEAGYDEDIAAEKAFRWNYKYCSPPMDDGEVSQIIRKAVSYTHLTLPTKRIV